MKIILRLIVVALLGTGAWFGYSWWEQREKPESTSLVLYGNVDIHQVDLAFRVGGRIQEMYVQEGDRVQANTKLAQLDTQPFEDELNLAQANLSIQEATLTKVESGYRSQEIEQARSALKEREATLDNLRVSLQRLQSLRKSGAIAQQSLDDASARVDEGIARRNAAQDQLNMVLQGNREEDRLIQIAAVDVAKANVAKARTALADTTLYAKEDCVVLTRVREKGAIVQIGQTVYTMALTDPVYIRAFVPQPKLGLIKPGAMVHVEIDAMPGKKYGGIVGFISPTAEFTPKTVETQEVRNDLVFRLRILADDPDNVLRQGMPVTITVLESDHA